LTDADVGPASRIALSLISHTNVGKTTLARTLLRTNVGEVRDLPHVTETADAYPLVESPAGDVLLLWDTPGFGDSARLLRRLEQSGNPLGWFLTQVWDRFVDRPFFSSQQAIRNVRDEADVVLYLVNAGEDPAAAGYVDAEMKILGWIGRPVLVLLNQLGPPRSVADEDHDVGRWSRHFGGHAPVRGVIAFDAFARCWVQEHALLDAIASVLPDERRAAFERLADAWRSRNRAIFEQSMQALAAQLAAAASHTVSIPKSGLAVTARSLLGRVLRGAEAGTDPGVDAAMGELARRLDEQVRAATDRLIELHGLGGRAAAEVLHRLGTEYAVEQAVDPGKSSVIGAALSGALGGLAADLAAGGLTFGAGALIGGLLGAAGGRGLAQAYNLARGRDDSVVRWSGEFLTGRVTGAALRYLAVAHFGRGRGDYVQGEYPSHWRAQVESAVARRGPEFAAVWSAAERGTEAAALEARLRPLLEATVAEVLAALYPVAAKA